MSFTVPNGTAGPAGLAELMSLDSRPRQVSGLRGSWEPDPDRPGKLRPATPRPRRKGSRPRDSRQSKVYRSEAPLHHGRNFTSVDEVQAFINDVTGARWFKSRWGSMSVPVIARTSGGSTGRYRGRINLARDHWNELTALHELAHVLESSPDRAGHGAEWVACYLLLVKQVMGQATWQALRASFVANKVPVATGVKALPKPGKYRVVPQAVEKAKKRALVTRPLTEPERAQAARLIRRGVTQGLYGPSGSKPRTHALATARVLEKG